MKKIFVVDWILVGASPLSLCSGVALHVAGSGSSHALWHNWAVAHVLSSAVFLAAAVAHVWMHWGWYRSFVRNGLGRKSRVTVVLTAVFLIVVLTGVALLGMDGANTNVGLWHYRAGLVVSVVAAGHTIKRLPLLRKSLAGRSNGRSADRVAKP